jgi:hypothetical protein
MASSPRTTAFTQVGSPLMFGEDARPAWAEARGAMAAGTAFRMAAPARGTELDQAPRLGHHGVGQRAAVPDGELGAAALSVLPGQGEWAAGLDHHQAITGLAAVKVAGHLRRHCPVGDTGHDSPRADPALQPVAVAGQDAGILNIWSQSLVTLLSEARLFAAVAVEIAVGAADSPAQMTRMPAWRRPGPGGPPGLQNRCEQRPCSGGFDSRPPPLSCRFASDQSWLLAWLACFLAQTLAQFLRQPAVQGRQAR